MKLKKLALLGGLLFAAASSQSWAVSPGKCDPAVGGPFDIDIYLTGASAPQAILGGIAAEIFTSGFTTVYDDGTPTGTKGAAYRAYCGTLNSLAGALNGKKVRFLNRAKGGSVFGVNPVATDQPIANLDFATCVTSVTAGRDFECAEKGDDLNAANPNNRKPDFGVSDVEPTMFKDPLNVEFGQVQLTPTQAAKFTGTQKASNQVIFGLPLTANVPLTSLSRTQMASILMGNFSDWSQVDASLAAGPITICRRVQGSGTQATFNHYFLNFPCTVGNIAQTGNSVPLRMADSAGYNVTVAAGTPADPIQIDPSAGVTIVENPGSGDVRTCLQKANQGQDYSFKGDDGRSYKVLFSRAGGPYRATGVLSLDSLNKGGGGSVWGTAGVDWNFVRLNGVDGTQANAQKGLYDFVMEQSIQYKNDKTYPTIDYKPFINLFIAEAQKETILRAISDVSVRGGVLGLPGVQGNCIGTAPACNTSNWTRNGNSCSPALLVQ